MNSNKGFTLIELIVVMTVFFLVIGTAIGIFISIVQHQKRILSEQELLNQTSYVVEYMSKALRMAKTAENNDCIPSGYIYLLTNPDISVSFYKGIKFINQSDDDACQEFFLDNSRSQTILREIKNGIPLGGTPLTSEKLHINSIKFGINGHNGCYGAPLDCPYGASEDDELQPGEGIQPRVTILMEVKVRNNSEAAPQKIQTTVSQRNLNTQ